VSIPADQMYEATAEVRKRSGSGLRQRCEYLLEPMPPECSDLPVSCAYFIDDIDESILKIPKIPSWILERHATVSLRVVAPRSRSELTFLRFRKGIQSAHVGECTTLKEIEHCPEDCSEIPEEPVCGSDGNVYR